MGGCCRTSAASFSPPKTNAGLPEGRSRAASAPQRQRDRAVATPAVPGPTRDTGTQSRELGGGQIWQRS